MINRQTFHLLTAVVVILLISSACASLFPNAATPALASISGAILYESNDPFLWIYAREVNTGEVYSVNPQAGAPTYTITDIPAGTYVVVGWFRELGASGAYTSLDTVIAEGEDQMHACEEAIIYIELDPGEEYAGADVGCWGGDFYDFTE